MKTHSIQVPKLVWKVQIENVLAIIDQQRVKFNEISNPLKT